MNAKEIGSLHIFSFSILFWGISALVLFQNTEKSIKLHLILQEKYLSCNFQAVFKQIETIVLGMTVRRNKVLIVENLVKNPFLPPLNS